MDFSPGDSNKRAILKIIQIWKHWKRSLKRRLNNAVVSGSYLGEDTDKHVEGSSIILEDLSYLCTEEYQRPNS